CAVGAVELELAGRRDGRLGQGGQGDVAGSDQERAVDGGVAGAIDGQVDGAAAAVGPHVQGGWHVARSFRWVVLAGVLVLRDDDVAGEVVVRGGQRGPYVDRETGGGDGLRGGGDRDRAGAGGVVAHVDHDALGRDAVGLGEGHLHHRAGGLGATAGDRVQDEGAGGVVGRHAGDGRALAGGGGRCDGAHGGRGHGAGGQSRAQAVVRRHAVAVRVGGKSGHRASLLGGDVDDLAWVDQVLALLLQLGACLLGVRGAGTDVVVVKHFPCRGSALIRDVVGGGDLAVAVALDHGVLLVRRLAAHRRGGRGRMREHRGVAAGGGSAAMQR